MVQHLITDHSYIALDCIISKSAYNYRIPRQHDMVSIVSIVSIILRLIIIWSGGNGICWINTIEPTPAPVPTTSLIKTVPCLVCRIYLQAHIGLINNLPPPAPQVPNRLSGYIVTFNHEIGDESAINALQRHYTYPCALRVLMPPQGIIGRLITNVMIKCY